MNKEQWLNSLSKDELAFRMFQRGYFGVTCLDCVFYKKDTYGRWKCSSLENEEECERQYAEWLESEME